jgi:hypothetical protein
MGANASHPPQLHQAQRAAPKTAPTPSRLLQVLTILDGTAPGWPGVSQAVMDVSDLSDMCCGQLRDLQSVKEAAARKQAELEAKTSSLSKALSGGRRGPAPSLPIKPAAGGRGSVRPPVDQVD